MNRLDTILRGRHFASGTVCDLHIANGSIVGVAEPGTHATFGDEGVWIAPGLLDLQVNGYQGHDLCSGDTTVDDVVALAAAMAEVGVTGFCPTVTTNSAAAMLHSLQTIASACQSSKGVREHIIGVHLEGPYLSPLDGPRGAHSPDHVRNPDWSEFCRFQEAAGGRIRLITLAPELPGALEFIRRATTEGIVVAIGHHAASSEEIAAAVVAGARLSTHLGNGAHSMLPRHPNYLWHQLAEDRLSASIVVDGFHLPPEVVKCFVRAKGVSRTILVSDVISPAGQPDGDYEFMGMRVRVDGRGPVRLSDTPYLAGASTTLAEAVHNVQRFAGVSFADAITMASRNPARLFGIGGVRGGLVPGARADLALFRETDDGFSLAAVLQAGVPTGEFA